MRIAVLATALSSAVVGLALADPAAAAIRTHTNIAPQELSSALRVLATDRHLQILYPTATVANRRTAGAVGEFTVEEVLAQLLGGTDLVFRYVDEKTITIVPRAESGPSGEPTTPAPPADANDSPPPRQERSADDEDPARSQAIVELEEIVVIGTRIRGQQPIGAQVITLDREYIDRSGQATVQDIVRALPQNFGGGISEDTRGGPEGNTNSSRGTALNLRGLGSGATLVLLNGRRLAPSGTEGRFTDVSNIPLTAVERVEVLPDGASSLYGSDAIGGVVNIVLRRDFEGAETRLSYGGTTQGPRRELQGSAIAGNAWSSGSLLLSAEYFDSTELPATEREQAASDLRRLGGSNFDVDFCNAGTIVVGGQTYAIPASQNGVGLTPGQFTAGTQNLCSRTEGLFLLAEQERYNLAGRLQQRVSDGATLFLEALFASRDVHSEGPNKLSFTVRSTNPFYVNPTGGTGPITVRYDGREALGPLVQEIGVDLFDVAGGLELSADEWHAVFQAGASTERQDQRSRFTDFTALNAALADTDAATAFNPFADGVNTNPATLATISQGQRLRFEVDHQIDFASLVVDGPLVSLPGGQLRAAVGSESRREGIESLQRELRPNPRVVANVDLKRDILAFFGELSVPLIGAGQKVPFVEALEISLSGRYEDYSDFGTTAVPRVGLTWGISENLALRGSWSEAFKAPRLAQLNEAVSRSFIVNVPNPSPPGGTMPALVWSGPSSELEPERAETWSIGLDADISRKFKFSATYFSVDYAERLETPGAFGSALTDPNYTGRVILSPTTAMQADVCARSVFSTNTSSAPGPCASAAIAAIVDGRTRNISGLTQRGADFDVSHERAAYGGELRLSLGGSWLFDYSRALSPNSGYVQVVDTLSNPIDLRTRAAVTWTNRTWELSSFINYADDYTDELSSPTRRIESWTTVDATVAYRFRDERGGTRATITISAQNVFDEPAPFVSNAGTFSGYDPENADLLGRMVRLSARVHW